MTDPSLNLPRAPFALRSSLSLSLSLSLFALSLSLSLSLSLTGVRRLRTATCIIAKA